MVPSDASTSSVHEIHGVRRLGRRAVPTLSITVSIVIHLAGLALFAAVVLQTAFTPAALPSEVVITFETPGLTLPAPSPSTSAKPSAAPRDDLFTVSTGVSASDPPPPMPSPLAPVLGLANAQMLAAMMSLRSAGAPGVAAGLEGTLSGSASAFSKYVAEHSPSGVTFAGLGASNARSVVYCVDCSGPMVTSLPMVLGEVRRSVARLAPTQKFAVVLFRTLDGSPDIQTFAPALMRATLSAQERLDNWLAAADPSGRSCPLAGLEAAIAFKPDAIFLLSRSIERSGGGVWELGLQSTLARLESLNPVTQRGRRDVLIQTIQFVDDDPTGVMQAIALTHGGGAKSYRIIKRGEEIAP